MLTWDNGFIQIVFDNEFTNSKGNNAYDFEILVFVDDTILVANSWSVDHMKQLIKSYAKFTKKNGEYALTYEMRNCATFETLQNQFWDNH